MSPPPPERKKRATEIRHIPTELVEEVVLNLPVKSLLRFSSVSKSWNSIIFKPYLVRKYDGRERIIVVSQNPYSKIYHIRSFPLSTIFSDNPIEEYESPDFFFPLWPNSNSHERPQRMVAFCDKLWCAESRGDNRSLFLLNPSMRTFRKLPHPNFPLQTDDDQSKRLYGLVYDNVGDDYKLLKIHYYSRDKTEIESEVYSLRSDSWRKINKPLSRTSILSLESCHRLIRSFVNGALHRLYPSTQEANVVVSLNLSTEEYGEMALPEYSPKVDVKELVVSSGKLCLCLSYRSSSTRKFVLWVMEEYGIVESWTKKFDIGCDRIPELREQFQWIPLCLYKDGQILFVAFMNLLQNGAIFMYKDDNTTLLRKELDGNKIVQCLLYVDSLVSP